MRNPAEGILREGSKEYGYNLYSLRNKAELGT